MTIFPSHEAEVKAKFTRSFRPNIFIFMINSNDTCYQKCVHCHRPHDLSNYQSWVSAPLNTNHFSELTKDDLSKLSSRHNTGIEHLPKFSSPKLLKIDVQNLMHKIHSVPRTPLMRVPKVN